MHNPDYTRRDFLKSVTTSTLAAMGLATAIPAMTSAAAPSQAQNYEVLQQNDVVLFQGDSITDAGRNRENTQPNSQSGLGPGYAFVAAADMLATSAGKNLKIFNRGVSGNKVFQLAARWQEDCLALQPDVLSSLVGVNDFWHTLTHGYSGTI
ncbi:MAG: GDSL-type esterase/lipase family protein, partial [Calditrichota bacterium]